MNDVRLRTGETLPAIIVTTTWDSLCELFRTNPIAFIEAYRLAADAGHRLFGISAQTLQAFNLIDADLHMPASIRAMLLACWEEGADNLLDPIERTD